ncbi:MAG TPA: ankyrin repeat domain-containing protein [Steroidobacteraceae bacterium]|nr:ankyrin repeat domain-containing protein [Steroidobacteraceae bacterium]
MDTLPERSNLDHLRKQAKDLLRAYRRGDEAAFERFRSALPALRGKSNAALAALQLRLHDAQSCVAREYGAASWNALRDQVELNRVRTLGARASQLQWLRLVYGGDVAGGPGQPRPELAARLYEEQPGLVTEPLVACAVGDVEVVRKAIDRDATWVNRAGGPLNIPPVIAVAHSSLARLDRYRDGLQRCLRLLLEHGADPNQTFRNRWAPHSLEQPGDEELTAIYGAAGKIHDEDMTRLLLAAGADANDNESLYHSIDDPRPDLPCTRLLLEAGTRVEGTNALAKVLDFDNLAGLKMLLAHTRHGDPDLGRILHWAIYRRRSAAHVRALLDAGADPRALDQHRQTASQHAATAGLPEVMRMLQGGSGEPLNAAEKFTAACARADEREARALLDANPGLIASLTEGQLKLLPNLAMSGRDDAVRLMVTLGWPIAERGGDIDGSALNWAVFRGRPELAEFLLRHGASFREQHGYHSDVIGTLSWASVNQPRRDGDWPGCAAALLAHGLPVATPVPGTDPGEPTRRLLVDDRVFHFPEDVAEVLLGPKD